MDTAAATEAIATREAEEMEEMQAMLEDTLEDMAMAMEILGTKVTEEMEAALEDTSMATETLATKVATAVPAHMAEALQTT